MVDLQIAGRGISDPRVLDAFRAVPREAFLPSDLGEFAYREPIMSVHFDRARIFRKRTRSASDRPS
jgi:protein-L-isoaspartate O-methyltransferase